MTFLQINISVEIPTILLMLKLKGHGYSAVNLIWGIYFLHYLFLEVMDALSFCIFIS